VQVEQQFYRGQSVIVRFNGASPDEMDEAFDQQGVEQKVRVVNGLRCRVRQKETCLPLYHYHYNDYC